MCRARARKRLLPALSPQRQLVLLSKMATLAGAAHVQFIVATHSPIILTFPNATLLSFDGETTAPTRLQDTSHCHITKGILDAPERCWTHLLHGDDAETG